MLSQQLLHTAGGTGFVQLGRMAVALAEQTVLTLEQAHTLSLISQLIVGSRYIGTELCPHHVGTAPLGLGLGLELAMAGSIDRGKLYRLAKGKRVVRIAACRRVLAKRYVGLVYVPGRALHGAGPFYALVGRLDIIVGNQGPIHTLLQCKPPDSVLPLGCSSRRGQRHYGCY